MAQESNMPCMRLETPPREALTYSVGNSSQILVISPFVLSHFRKNQQNRWFRKEAGGQLFARLSLEQVVVERATGPRKSDFRTRTSIYLMWWRSSRRLTIRIGMGCTMSVIGIRIQKIDPDRRITTHRASGTPL